MKPQLGSTTFEHVTHYVDDGTELKPVLGDCSFALGPGEIVAMIGPSGCGKSTIGYLLAGYDRPTSGRIAVDGRPVGGPSAERLLLFQENALMPWLTTFENVMFGPRARGRRPRTSYARPRTSSSAWGCTSSTTATPASCPAACDAGPSWPGR